MKEFIEKLIERLEELSGKAEQEMNYYRELSKEDALCEVFADSHKKEYEAYCKAMDIVNQLAEKYNNGWILCEKELPPQPEANPAFDNRPVELYLVSEENADYPFRAFWNGKHFTDGFSVVDVVAWQPMPTAYRTEGE